MKYVAKTYDSEGSIIEVTIGKESDTESTEIGSGGLYLAASEAVTITGETNDSFDTLLPQSATLRLITDRFIPDFYQGDCRNAPVRIKVGGSTVWRGYVSPMNYTQQWCTAADDLTVNCIDWAAALQFVKYKDCGTGTTWEQLVEAGGDHSLRAILEECIAMVTDMPVSYRGVPVMPSADLNPETNPADSGEILTEDGSPFLLEDGGTLLLEGGTAVTALDSLCVNDRLFLGDSEDDVWTAQEVVTEILRYLNLHATQRAGVIEVYPWEEAQRGTSYEINGTTTYGDGHTISMTEMFNRISLSADMEDAEELIPSMLDDELLQSRFTKSQIYCTEYNLIANGNKDYENLGPYYVKMMAGLNPRTISDSELSRRYWYMRAMNAPQWRCYGKRAQRWHGSLPVPDTNQYDGQFEGGTGVWPGSWSATTYQNSRLDMLIASLGSTIVKLDTFKEVENGEDDSVNNERNSETLLTFGVGGTFVEGKKPTQDHIDALHDNLLSAVPRMSFQGTAAELSPVDEITTRYIVISGKIGLAPVINSGYFGNYLMERASAAVNGNDYLTDLPKFANVVKSGSDGKRWFNRYYYTCATPEGSQQSNPYCNGVLNEDNAALRAPLFFTPISEETGQYFKFEYSRKNLMSQAKYDRIPKVGILACMLIVGDKCVVETGDGSRPENYVWKPFKTREQCEDDNEFFAQSFSIGFNPKLGDFIVGKKYDIANTIDAARWLEDKGLAIPIRKADNVKGEVTFIILGPNTVRWEGGLTMWYEFLADRLTGNSVGVDLLSYVSHIDLVDFEMKVVSDNGGDDPLKDSDLVYVSDTDETYLNEKDDISMKLCSALTAEERRTFGTRDTRSLSTVREIATGLGVLSVKDPRTHEVAKPEQFYVDRAWRDTHSPKIEIEHGIRTARINADMLCSYTHQAMPGRKFWPLAITRDLQTNSATIRLREI